MPETKPQPIESLKNRNPTYPHERDVPRSEGPWTVIPSDRKPYKFAVIGKDKKPVAFATQKETAESYARQLEVMGYIDAD